MHQGRYPGYDWRRGVSPMRRFQDPMRDVSLDRYILKGVSPLNRPEGRAPTRRGVSPLNREDGNNDFAQDSTIHGVMAMASTPLDRSHVSETTNKVSVSGFIGTRQPLFKPPKLNLGIKSSTNNQNMQASKKETVKVPGASADAKRKPLPSSSEVSTSKKQTSSVKTVTTFHTKKAVDVSTINLPEWNSDISRSASSSSTSCSSSTSLDLNEENVITKQSAASDDKTSPAKALKKKVRFSQVAWTSDVDETTIKTRFSKPQPRALTISSDANQPRAFTISSDENQSELDTDTQPQLRPPPPPLVPYTGDANRRLVPPMSRLSLEDIQLINESRKRRRDMSSVHTGDLKKRKLAPPDDRNEVGYVTRPKQWWLRKRRQLRRKHDKPSSSSTSSSAVSASASATTTTSPGSASSSCPTSISAAPTASSSRRSVKRKAPDDECCSGDGVKRSRFN